MQSAQDCHDHDMPVDQALERIESAAQLPDARRSAELAATRPTSCRRHARRCAAARRHGSPVTFLRVASVPSTRWPTPATAGGARAAPHRRAGIAAEALAGRGAARGRWPPAHAVPALTWAESKDGRERPGGLACSSSCGGAASTRSPKWRSIRHDCGRRRWSSCAARLSSGAPDVCKSRRRRARRRCWSCRRRCAPFRRSSRRSARCRWSLTPSGRPPATTTSRWWRSRGWQRRHPARPGGLARYGPKLAQVALTFGADDVDNVSASDEAPRAAPRAARGDPPQHRGGRLRAGRAGRPLRPSSLHDAAPRGRGRLPRTARP